MIFFGRRDVGDWRFLVLKAGGLGPDHRQKRRVPNNSQVTHATIFTIFDQVILDCFKFFLRVNLGLWHPSMLGADLNIGQEVCLSITHVIILHIGGHTINL